MGAIRLTQKGSSATDGWIPSDESFFRLDIDVIQDEDIIEMRTEKIKKSDLIGAEIIGILEDDLGDMFRLKLKDGRILIFVQGDEGRDSYFVTHINRSKGISGGGA